MLTNKKYDVGIIGDLCSNDLNLAETLAKAGLEVLVFDKTNFGKQTEIVDNYHSTLQTGYSTYIFKDSFDFYKKACACRAIMSFTASILGPLKKIYPLSLLPCFPPIINIATGSDITELIKEKSVKAIAYRAHLKMSALNWMVEYPHALKNLQQYNIPRVYFFPFPAFRLPEKKTELNKKTELTFFHPSHLDWQETDCRAGRNSSKGNNRFIKAFIRAVKDGLDAKCIILDRGSDKENAKQLIKQLGGQDYFIWKRNLSRDELFRTFEESHVIVDQFDVGAVGGIAVEAMGSGRPVITYVQNNCARLQYGGDTPPVLNAWSDEEIYDRIMSCQDMEFLQKIADESYSWVHRQHSPELVCDRILYYFFMLTGKKFKDYGWSRNAYAQNIK